MPGYKIEITDGPVAILKLKNEKPEMNMVELYYHLGLLFLKLSEEQKLRQHVDKAKKDLTGTDNENYLHTDSITHKKCLITKIPGWADES